MRAADKVHNINPDHVRGWIRASRRQPEGPQRKLIEAAGCTAIYAHGEDKLEHLIADLKSAKGRAPTVVLVRTIARLTSYWADLNGAIKAIHAAGSSVLELDTGRCSNVPDELQDMLFAARDEYGRDARALTPRQAKTFGAKGGAATKKKREASRAPIADARLAWLGNPHLTNDEVRALPAMEGWTEASSYRHFGGRNRGIALRIGRPRKNRGKQD